MATTDVQQVFDELPDAVVVADESGVVSLANAAARVLLGADPLGRDFRDALPLTDPAGRDWWECTRPYQGLPTRTGQPERRLLLRRADGESSEVLMSARYVREERRLVRLVMSLRPATAHERLERSRADLVSTVAHELRSPLTSVKGFTATLLAKWDRFNDEQKRVMLQTVNADADRVTRLISELLDVSRIEAGRVEVRRQVVDLPATVERVFAGQTAAGVAADRLHLRVHGPLPELWADQDKLEQVLLNLVENGLRHGGGTVSVEVDRHGDGVQVRVSDEGAGIPPEEWPRVFMKFWHGAHRAGTGLGLFIVRGLIEAHGGSIEVDATADGGAEFRFVLPAGTPEFAR
jgi:signal transduction histidine kinase